MGKHFSFDFGSIGFVWRDTWTVECRSECLLFIRGAMRVKRNYWNNLRRNFDTYDMEWSGFFHVIRAGHTLTFYVKYGIMVI